MELTTFIQSVNDGDALEYRLNTQNKLFTLTNVAKHVNGIYKFKEPVKGSESDKFLIEYSGNIISNNSGLESKIAHYI